MKKIIFLLLFISINFGSAQKKYDFNLYSVYQNTYPNYKVQSFIFTDSLNTNYFLRISIKDDTLIGASLSDYEKSVRYSFDVRNKKIDEFDFSKDFSSSYKHNVTINNEILDRICKENQYYDRTIKKLNDSTIVETFKYYKRKNKKKLTSTVIIESSTRKKMFNHLQSDFIFLIIKCIDKSYKSNLIYSTDSVGFREDGSKIEEHIKLIEINTTNFSINTQE